MDRPGFPTDALPPEATYESRESLLAAINAWAKPRGYAFTTGKSLKTPNGRVKVIFACDRNKQPPSASIERTRRTSSRRTGCKFSVWAKQSRDRCTWVLSHRPDPECATHNHPPSDDPSAHPAHRRLEKKDAAIISDLSMSGAAPREIRNYLSNHSDTLATQRDIYNRIATTRRDIREGQSSIQALVDQLYGEGFWCRVKLDSNNRLTAIFFAHPDSVAYLQCNPDVLLLDCTYKTNKHAMPLLDMVGVDSCQRSFCIAFAFLSGESEEDYSWALQHLRSLYERDLPSVVLTDRCIAAMNAAAVWFSSSKAVLCLWHVIKAILQRCRPFFASKESEASGQNPGDSAWNDFYGFWHSIVASTTETTFRDRLAKFELKYGNEYLEPVGYIKMYWLDPHKEMIVKAWVDQHLHFGNIATSRQVVCNIKRVQTDTYSRAEGIHSLMKSHIKTSTFDLFDVWQAMKHAITNQLKELKHIRVSQQVRLPLDVSGVLFEAVRGWVSHYALRKVQEQRQLLQKPNRVPCSQAFTTSLGLPCSHALMNLEKEGRSLLLEHFHPHWHLRRDVDQPQPVLEPRRAVERFSQKRTQPATSTRREPSGFERVEAGRRAPRRCSKCQSEGHVKNSRHCPLRFQGLLTQAAQASSSTAQPSTAIGPVPMPASDGSEEPGSRDQQASAGDMVADVPAEACLTPIAPLPQGHSPALVLNPPNSPAPTTISADDSADISVGPIHERLIDQPSSLGEVAPQSRPRYDSPEAIYSRYIAARSAWFQMQPAGSVKTNQQYRRAMRLPQRYDKTSYEWCLDYKQMSKRCITAAGSREWTREEMMAYLDWNKVEDERVEALVAEEVGDNPLATGRRGVKEIWRRIEKDSREQQALYSAASEAEDLAAAADGKASGAEFDKRHVELLMPAHDLKNTFAAPSLKEVLTRFDWIALAYIDPDKVDMRSCWIDVGARDIVTNLSTCRTALMHNKLMTGQKVPSPMGLTCASDLYTIFQRGDMKRASYPLAVLSSRSEVDCMLHEMSYDDDTTETDDMPAFDDWLLVNRRPVELRDGQHRVAALKRLVRSCHSDAWVRHVAAAANDPDPDMFHGSVAEMEAEMLRALQLSGDSAASGKAGPGENLAVPAKSLPRHDLTRWPSSEYGVGGNGSRTPTARTATPRRQASQGKEAGWTEPSPVRASLSSQRIPCRVSAAR
ncbi:hypothetical protein PCL_07390 [Purpureocillium lilacinum]|uniref:MULE transposase domain-containing protein n=1 Tax=Purpureocillium lilacinum TaxID=33203 RepID=A0A2U3DS53_PURLI|nr:hypothetical protein PCL_07390 [Purpureocillium lilacinum]